MHTKFQNTRVFLLTWTISWVLKCSNLKTLRPNRRRNWWNRRCKQDKLSSKWSKKRGRRRCGKSNRHRRLRCKLNRHLGGRSPVFSILLPRRSRLLLCSSKCINQVKPRFNRLKPNQMLHNGKRKLKTLQHNLEYKLSNNQPLFSQIKLSCHKKHHSMAKNFSKNLKRISILQQHSQESKRVCLIQKKGGKRDPLLDSLKWRTQESSLVFLIMAW